MGAEAGIPLFIEKPLATDRENPSGLIEVATRKRVPIMVGMMYRFNEGLRFLKELMEQETFGKLQFAKFHGGHYLPDWRPGVDYRVTYSARSDLGGGVLLDSIHALDLVRWLIGDPTQLYAILARTGHLETDIEDLVSALVEIPPGILVELHVDYLQRVKEDTIVISGVDGLARWDRLTGELSWFKPGQGWARRQFSTDTNQMYVEEMRTFLAVLEGASEPTVDGAHAMATLEFARRIRESSETGKPVRCDA